MARLKKYGKEPDLTPESVRASLKKKYEKDPKRYQRIYFSVFPKPVDTSRYEAEIAKLSRFRDEMSLQRIASLRCKIHRLQQRHARRLERSSEIILEHIRRRLTRWEELHKGPIGKFSSSPSTCSLSTLSRQKSPSLCTISTQTEEFSDSSSLEEFTEPQKTSLCSVPTQTDDPSENDSSALQELREQLRCVEEQKQQLVLDLQQAQFELSMLQDEKDNILENESSARDELREQLRKAEEDKQQLILELQQTRFELCVLQDEKEDKLAKKKKGPLSFLRKKN